ncbi:hypothetical protein Tco_0007477 [Tanacetum coccineum]
MPHHTCRSSSNTNQVLPYQTTKAKRSPKPDYILNLSPVSEKNSESEQARRIRYEKVTWHSTLLRYSRSSTNLPSTTFELLKLQNKTEIPHQGITNDNHQGSIGNKGGYIAGLERKHTQSGRATKLDYSALTAWDLDPNAECSAAKRLSKLIG